MQAHQVMTAEPVTCPADTLVSAAATLMRDRHVGDVLVTNDDGLYGIVTDRDIVVRAVAGTGNPTSMTLGDICSSELHAVGPDSTVDAIIDVMRRHALRRVPVVDGSTAVGMVSIGDLAMARDGDSVLAAISSAPPSS